MPPAPTNEDSQVRTGWRLDENARCQAWQLEQYLSLGFAPQEADLLVICGVGYHEAEMLLHKGATVAWVFEYLLPDATVLAKNLT